MAEITTEGHMSTTTTVMDNNNGSVLTPPVKVGKKSVTEDIMTTFSSPAAWLLVVALIVTWSAVAIIMFDLVDYKTFAGSSVNKLSKEPLRIIHQTMEESTDWLYGLISLLSDIVLTDDDDSDEGEVEPPLKKKEIHKIKPARQEKLEKPAPKVIHKEKPEKQEKIEWKEQPKAMYKDKSERPEKPEKKEKLIVAHKTKPEKQEKSEKAPPKGQKETVPPHLLVEQNPRKKPAALAIEEARIALLQKEQASRPTTPLLARHLLFPNHRDSWSDAYTLQEEKPLVIAKEVKRTEEEKRITQEKRAIPETKKKGMELESLLRD
uniref:Triadin n=1 Tax=Gopherus agassizii TaxID=38772 RepID=A0A452HRB0_9SAUR